MCPLWVLCDFICLAHAFGIQALPNVTLRVFFSFADAVTEKALLKSALSGCQKILKIVLVMPSIV